MTSTERVGNDKLMYRGECEIDVDSGVMEWTTQIVLLFISGGVNRQMQVVLKFYFAPVKPKLAYVCSRGRTGEGSNT